MKKQTLSSWLASIKSLLMNGREREHKRERTCTKCSFGWLLVRYLRNLFILSMIPLFGFVEVLVFRSRLLTEAEKLFNERICKLLVVFTVELAIDFVYIATVYFQISKNSYKKLETIGHFFKVASQQKLSR